MSVDVSAVIAGLFPALGAAGADDLGFWTVDELYSHASAAVSRLARTTCMWVERDSSTTLVTDQAEYATPARCESVIHTSIGGRALTPTGMAELEALDDQWSSASDPAPLRFAQDVSGLNFLRLYPAPATGGAALSLVMRSCPISVTALSPQLEAPSPAGVYLGFAVLAAARGRESKAAMPEVAQVARQWADALENVFAQYWGVPWPSTSKKSASSPAA